MSTYPLEWGWHTAPTSNTSSASEWKPKPTILGGAGRDLAAAGDRRCQGPYCTQEGAYGATGHYEIGGTIMCRDCAVKVKKIDLLPGKLQDDVLRKLELK